MCQFSVCLQEVKNMENYQTVGPTKWSQSLIESVSLQEVPANSLPWLNVCHNF